jgi:hypothetical protein
MKQMQIAKQFKIPDYSGDIQSNTTISSLLTFFSIILSQDRVVVNTAIEAVPH